MSPRMRLSRFVLAATVLAGPVAGCSPGTDAPPRVATLQTGAAPVTSSSAATDRRPIFPLDATDDDKQAMSRAWENCLVQAGGPSYRGAAELLIGKGAVDADSPARAAVIARCADQQPETFEDHQERTDLTG